MASSAHTGSALRLAVVGTGALGSEFCRLLIEARQAHVLLIDPDALEQKNIAMSKLFREASGFEVGMPKVEVVRRMAERQGLAWDATKAEIADVGWLDLRRCDLLVCCADSVLARVETAATARSLRLPMLDAAVTSDGHPHGRLAFFPADPEQACYLCGLAEHRRAEVLAYALSPSLGCLPHPDFEVMTGSLDVLRKVAEQLIRLVDTMAECGPAYALRLDTRTGVQQRIALTRSAGCPWHDLPGPQHLLPLPYDEPLAAALNSGPDSTALELFWPVCLRARCLRCGLIVAPRARAALVRRRGVCGHCAESTKTIEPGHSAKLEPLDCVTTFRAGDALAALTPRQLGLPPRHLYYRRPVAMHREGRADHS